MRLHFVSNSLFINSGFGKVTRYIALGLKKLNHDVSMTGLQTSQRTTFDYGIQCLPIDTEHVDETTQLILNIQKTNPDIVFYMGQLDADLNHLAKVFPKTVSYSPVEGNNIPLQMANDMLQIEKNGGLLVAQCRYGQQEMKKVGVSAEMIYHGYDPDIFYPTKNFKPYCYYATSQGQINTDPVILCKQGCFNCKEKDLNKINCNCQYWEEEIVSILKWDKDNKKWSQNDIPISKLKEQFNNKYIYQFTGQNFGLRKQISRLLNAYSILINESRQIKDNTILAMHTLPISIRGVDLIKIITELGINENVIFTYGTFASSGWSETAMNIWYNMADINISASSSEGFGLGTLESMACGVPNIGPNCSSFTELIGEDKDQNKNRGLLAKIATQHMIQDGSYRSLVDEKDLMEKMKIMYVKKEDREIYSKNAIKFAQKFTWNKVIKQWNDLLQEML